MTSTPSPATHRIVVGHDGSPGSLAALAWAADAAERGGDEVLVVQSSREPLTDGRSWAEVWDDPYAARSRAEDELQQVLGDAARDHPTVRWTGRVETGPADDVLVAAAAEGRVLVVGHRGRGGFAELLLGSTARKVAGRSEGTVVVVRGAPRTTGDVVVGVDGSDASRAALAWAAAEARSRRARLHVVLAWSYLLPEGEHGAVPFSVDYSSEEAERVLGAICDDVLGDAADLEVRREAVCELAAKALLERSADAALLVVGPERGSLRRRPDLGSVTAQLLHHAPCPLVIVRHPDEGSGS